MFDIRTSILEESIHFAFDETRPQKTEKSCSTFNVSWVLDEALVNNDYPKEGPPKSEDIKVDKEEIKQ